MFFGSWLVSCKDNKDPVTNMDPWKVQKVIAVGIQCLAYDWILGVRSTALLTDDSPFPYALTQVLMGASN